VGCDQGITVFALSAATSSRLNLKRPSARGRAPGGPGAARPGRSRPRGRAAAGLLDCDPVNSTRPRPLWPALLLLALGLAVLYADALRTGFLSDDYLFLEQSRTRSLLQSLSEPGGPGGYFRPLSREFYFRTLAPLAGGHPLVFHVANFALFLAALALLFDLLRALLPLEGAVAGTVYFALLPLQRVNLAWVSCSQDLLALVFSLASLALFRRGRGAWTALTALGALASKEAALPLPIALAAWGLWVERARWRDVARRTLPVALLAAAWGVLALRMRARIPSALPALRFDPVSFLAGYVHGVQSLVGLDHPSGFLRGLFARGPSPLALALIGAALLCLPARPAGRPAAAPIARFAGAWFLAFGLAVGPVVHNWSSYYYTLPAVGAALVVGLALPRARGIAGVALAAALLWWHAGATATRAFAIVDRPWVWTSHLTAFYLERAASLAGTLSRQLKSLEPQPPAGTRFFFVTVPPWAAFQMGNGPLVRALYRDPTLGSHFYSQFSESTAAERPCRFFYWDGAELRRLYGRAADPFFQVGSDLLLLDRLDGAAHGFRRGLAAGGNRMDLLYWLGWTELWRGRRAQAEAAWRDFGAHDDSLRWSASLLAARNALLVDRDTLATRRHLASAIQSGIGRPEAHAVLGELLMVNQPKYGMLELKVAVWLEPGDLLARRELLEALVTARLDEQARRELEALTRLRPAMARDTAVAGASRTLARRTPGAQPVVEF
jgi:hypothetical protein